MTRSTAIQRSRIVMFGWRRARARSTSWIARPVASAAWAMRRTAWPPSRVRCRPSGPSGSVVNGTPCSTSHSIAWALCSAMNARRVLVDEAGAGLLGVADVQLDAVVVAQHADDAALGPGRRGLVEAALGEQDDRVPVGEVEGDGQAGEAGPDDDDGGPGWLRGGLRGGRFGDGGVHGAHAVIVGVAADLDGARRPRIIQRRGPGPGA